MISSSDKAYLDDLIKRADSGDLEALYEVGAHYDMGDLVDVDKLKASKIFQEAANRGHAHSMWIHACELLWGMGSFPQSIPDGTRYLDAAIEAGSIQACITKARMHTLGELGVSKDTNKAEELCRLAKEHETKANDYT